MAAAKLLDGRDRVLERALRGLVGERVRAWHLDVDAKEHRQVRETELEQVAVAARPQERADRALGELGNALRRPVPRQVDVAVLVRGAVGERAAQPRAV